MKSTYIFQNKSTFLFLFDHKNFESWRFILLLNRMLFFFSFSLKSRWMFIAFWSQLNLNCSFRIKSWNSPFVKPEVRKWWKKVNAWRSHVNSALQRHGIIWPETRETQVSKLYLMVETLDEGPATREDWKSHLEDFLSNTFFLSHRSSE